jgi:hypothetical protein
MSEQPAALGAARPLAAFRGPVSCRREPQGALGLTLAGRAADEPGDVLTVAFTGRAPAQLPDTLADPVIESDAPGEYRIHCGAGVWRIAAAAVHLHRDIAPRFYRALPPRPAPRARRFGYRVLLALAASRLALAALRALRR